MNNGRGYVRSYRQTEDSAVFESAEVFRLWSWLLWNANWKEGQLLNGQTLAPGQLVVSKPMLAKRFKCGKSSIGRRLATLQKLGNIGTVGGKMGTLVTINNWTTYQQDGPEGGPISGLIADRCRTDSGPLADPEVKGKKGKREDKLGARFVKPTLQEVDDYCDERSNGIDPQAFLDHYEANGWVQGRGKPIKSWKACVRTWENQRREETKPPESRLPTAEEDANWNPTDGGLGL